MNKLLVLPVLLCLSGCDPVDSDLARTMQMQMGQLRIEPSMSPSDSYDYAVTFPVMIDFGFNTRNPDDRLRYVTGVMKSQCNTIEILDETETVLGYSPNGNERIQYTVKVNCT